MKIRNAILAAVSAVVLVSGAVAPAQGPGFGERRPPLERLLGPGSGGRWWNDPNLVDKLKLTDDQRKAMDQILYDHREKLIDMHAAVDKAELAMQPLLQADQPNEGQILAQIDKIAQARAELEKANARFLLALRAKLTPEQWKQLQAMRADRRDDRHMGPGMGRHGMRGPGGRGNPGPGGPDSGPGGPAGPPSPGPQGFLHLPQEPGLAPPPQIGVDR